MDDNRRRFFRHSFHSDVCGEICLIFVGDISVSSKKAYVCVKDISAGGVRFESHLRIPTRPDVLIQFEIRLLDNLIVLQGVLNRTVELSNGLYEYGMNFLTSEDESNNLARIINDVNVRSRRTLKGTGCDFCSSRTQCHKNSKKNPSTTPEDMYVC